MANCPKCGRKLKLFDLKPECPECGVNLLYYKIEERLEVDAINAELEHCKTQKRIDRAKASYVGSPLTIARIVLLLLVVGMLFLPLATLHTVGPYFDNTLSINAMEVYNKVSALDFDGLFTMIGSTLAGTAFTMLLVSIVTVALAAVCALLELILSFLSCSPHGFIRNVVFSVLGIIFTAVSAVTYSAFIRNIKTILPGLIDGKVQAGTFLTIAAFALVLAINIIIKNKGINIKYKDTFIDSVPSELFIEKFGEKRFDLDSLEEIKPELNALKQN